MDGENSELSDGCGLMFARWGEFEVERLWWDWQSEMAVVDTSEKMMHVEITPGRGAAMQQSSLFVRLVGCRYFASSSFFVVTDTFVNRAE